MFVFFFYVFSPADTRTHLALAFTNASIAKKIHPFYYTASSATFSAKSVARVKKDSVEKEML